MGPSLAPCQLKSPPWTLSKRCSHSRHITGIQTDEVICRANLTVKRERLEELCFSTYAICMIFSFHYSEFSFLMKVREVPWDATKLFVTQLPNVSFPTWSNIWGQGKTLPLSLAIVLKSQALQELRTTKKRFITFAPMIFCFSLKDLSKIDFWRLSRRKIFEMFILYFESIHFELASSRKNTKMIHLFFLVNRQIWYILCGQT